MAKRLNKIYDSQMSALKASRKKSKKYVYSIKPTKGFYLGYQLLRRKK